MRHRAAERAAVAHLRIADPAGDVRQQRRLGAGDGGALQLVVPGARTDATSSSPSTRT